MTDEEHSLKVLGQLETAGYLHLLQDVSMYGRGVHFFMTPEVQKMLADDPRFLNDPFYHLHVDDVGGHPCCGRRAISGTFGKGSTQIVWNSDTGRGFADVDKFSPVNDLVGTVGHMFGEVIPNFFKRLFGKKKKKDDE